MNTKKKIRHEQHAKVSNWGHVNNEGHPALQCAVCRKKRGPRKGKRAYIKWLGVQEILHLINEVGVEEVYEDV